MGAALDSDVLEPDDGTIDAEVAKGGAFRGTGTKVEGAFSVGYDEVKAAIREKRWKDALPTLMAMAGMTGAICFGMLAGVVKAESKLAMGAVAAFFWYAFVRIWIEFARTK
jgi:prolipoprotein diacylglyceryltransferase